MTATPTLLRPPAVARVAELEAQLADARHVKNTYAAMARRLADENAELRRRIDGAVFLVDQFDPTSGAGRAAVFRGDLRLTLGSSRDAKATPR